MQEEQCTDKTEVTLDGDDELEEWEENLEGLENIVDTGIGDLDSTELEEMQGMLPLHKSVCFMFIDFFCYITISFILVFWMLSRILQMKLFGL